VSHSLAINAQTPPNQTSDIITSKNENIVFADLHIIQAINDLIEHNASGALDQLAQAQEQLRLASR
jgi:hypothetical protein